MVVKLKSTLKQIHWSLAAKTGIFGLGLIYLPYWIFVALALALYFYPPFHSGKFLFPFAVAIFFSLSMPKEYPIAILMSAIFLLILGIKDLVIVNRIRSYGFMVSLIAIFACWWFFYIFGNGGAIASVQSLALAVIAFLLVKGFIDYSYFDSNSNESKSKYRSYTIVLLGSLVISELSGVLTLIPLSFHYQSVFLATASIVLFWIIIDYLEYRLTRKKILAGFSVVFSLLGIMLAII
jgi:hypothetical protein